MSTPSVAAQVPPWIWQLAASTGLALAGAVVAWYAGAFRARSVAGPARVTERESVARLWMLLLFGFGAWVMAVSVAAAVLGGRAADGKDVAPTTAQTRPAPATSPTTAATLPTTSADVAPPAQALAPRDQVTIGVVAPALALVALLLADSATLPGALRRLGLAGHGDAARVLRWGVAAALVAISFTFAASQLAGLLWQQFGREPPQDHELIRIIKTSPEPALRWWVALSAVVIAPLWEELFFRGHFQTALASSFRLFRARQPITPADDAEPTWPRWAAITVASLFFASVHDAGPGSRWMLPPLFLLSVCLGYAYERTGSLWVPILVHAAFNALSVSLVLFR